MEQNGRVKVLEARGAGTHTWEAAGVQPAGSGGSHTALIVLSRPICTGDLGMPTTHTLTVCDESTLGDSTVARTLEFPTETITVRELIRERVYQEVQDYQRGIDVRFKGLVEPTSEEVALNGPRAARPRRDVDWKAQFDIACAAYERQQILIIANDRQTTSLDETITLTRGSEVSFLKLTPLVGG